MSAVLLNSVTQGLAFLALVPDYSNVCISNAACHFVHSQNAKTQVMLTVAGEMGDVLLYLPNVGNVRAAITRELTTRHKPTATRELVNLQLALGGDRYKQAVLTGRILGLLCADFSINSMIYNTIMDAIEKPPIRVPTIGVPMGADTIKMRGVAELALRGDLHRGVQSVILLGRDIKVPLADMVLFSASLAERFGSKDADDFVRRAIRGLNVEMSLT